MTDKALETIYTVRGISRVIHTEPTGNAARTNKAHTAACKAVLAALYSEVNAEWLESIDAELDAVRATPNKFRHGRERQLVERRKRVAGQKVFVYTDSFTSARKPHPRFLPTSRGFNLDDYRESSA